MGNECSSNPNFAPFCDRRFPFLFHILFTFSLPLLLLNPNPLTLWICISIFGFCYVAGVTCERENCFGDDKTIKTREFFKLFLATPLVFIAGPCVALYPPPDSYLLESFNFEEYWPYFFRNYICYVIPFVFGLHFTYLDYLPSLRTIECSLSAFRVMNRLQWIVVFIAAVIISFLFVFHIIFWVESKEWMVLLVVYAAIIFLFILMFLFFICIRGTHYFHLHHYQIFGLLIPMTRIDSNISAICQAVCCGIMIEGISRWGIQPCFIIHKRVIPEVFMESEESTETSIYVLNE